MNKEARVGFILPELRQSILGDGESIEEACQQEDSVVIQFFLLWEKLGIKEARFNRYYPDAEVLIENPRNGNQVWFRVEFESKSSNFHLHRHDPTEVDLVVCWEVDEELEVPILELSRIIIEEKTAFRRDGNYRRKHFYFDNSKINNLPYEFLDLIIRPKKQRES